MIWDDVTNEMKLPAQEAYDCSVLSIILSQLLSSLPQRILALSHSALAHFDPSQCGGEALLLYRLYMSFGNFARLMCPK